MAVNVKSVKAIGLKQVFWGCVDSSGFFIGNSSTKPANGSGEDWQQLKLAKTFPVTLNETERVTITGDDGADAQFQFDPIDLPSGDIEFAASDMAFAAAAMGLTVDEVAAGEFLLMQPTNPSFQDLMLITVSQVKSNESGSLNSSGYGGIIVLRANAFYRGRNGFSEREPASFLWGLTASKGNRYPWGVPFSLVNNGATEAVAVEYTWPYRPHLQVWVGNGAGTTITLTKTPVTTTAENFIVTVNGTEQTWVAAAPAAGQFSVSGTTLTLGVAPAAGELVEIWYGW